MVEHKITLLISGNKIGAAGFSQVLKVGDFPLGLEDLSYPINFGARHCFYFQHTPSYRKIVLMCKPSTIAGNNQNRAGRLSFAITIPRGQRIAGGKTPYDLLLEIKDEFMKNNMNSYDNGVYEFKAGDYDKQPFEEMLNRYPLEKGSSRHIVTAGATDAYIVATEDKIRDLLKDPQYAEFANYKVIWVCSQGNPQNSPTIEIPRPHKYEIYINDRAQGAIGEYESYNSTVKPDSNTSESVGICFTIDQLRNGYSQNNVTFSLNEVAERVDCKVTFPKKQYTRVINLRFAQDITDAEKNVIKSKLELKAANGEECHLNWENGIDQAVGVIIGNKISYGWALVGDPRYTYNGYNFNDSAEILESRAPVSILRKKQRIIVPNVPREVLSSNSQLKVRIKMEYEPDVDISLTKGSDNSSLSAEVNYSVLDLSKRIEKVRFVWEDKQYVISEGCQYNYEPNNCTLKIYNLKVTKKEVIISPAGVSPQQYGSQGNVSQTTQKGEAGKCSCLIIKCDKAEHPQASVHLKLKHPQIDKIVSKKIKEGLCDDVTIEYPAAAELESITFKAYGYKEYPYENCKDKKSVKFPEMQKLSFLEKNKRKIILLTLLAVACVVTFMFGLFIPNPKISRTKPYISWAQEPADNLLKQKDEQIKHLQDSIKMLIEYKSQKELKKEPVGGRSQETTSPTTQPSAVHPNQAQLNKYIEQCENATLPFTDIAAMSQFVEGCSTDAAQLINYNKLKDYAGFYSRAYEVVIKIRANEYGSTFEIIQEGQPITQEAYSKYQRNLFSFIGGLGTLCVIHKGKENDDQKYMREVMMEPDIIKAAQNFRDLKTCRTNWNPSQSE